MHWKLVSTPLIGPAVVATVATFAISQPALADRIECTLTQSDETNGNNACTVTYKNVNAANNYTQQKPLTFSLDESTTTRSDTVNIYNMGANLIVQLISDNTTEPTEPSEQAQQVPLNLKGGGVATWNFFSDPTNGTTASDLIVQVPVAGNLLNVESVTVSPIPEPSGLSLLLLGAAGLISAGRRRPGKRVSRV